MWKFTIALIQCALLILANDISSMDCVNEKRTCEVDAVLQQGVAFEKKLDAPIKCFKPTPSTPCDPAKTICPTIKEISKMIAVEGKVGDASVDRFKFVFPGKDDVYTMLQKPAPPDPECTGITCTEPSIATVSAENAVLRLNVTLPFLTAHPIASGQNAAGQTVANVFGNEAHQVQMTVINVIRVYNVAGRIKWDETALLEFDVGNTHLYTYVKKSGDVADPVCPSDKTCTNPAFVTAVDNGGTMSITSTDLLFEGTRHPISVNVLDDKLGPPYGSMGSYIQWGQSCNPSDKICLKTRPAKTKVQLAGKIPDKTVVRLLLAENSQSNAPKAYTLIKRMPWDACASGLKCTVPPVIRASVSGELTRTDLTLPTEISEVTPTAYSDSTLVENVFGGKACDKTKYACAKLGASVKSTVVLSGHLDEVPKQIEVQLDGKASWFFKFNRSSGMTAIFLPLAALFVLR